MKAAGSVMKFDGAGRVFIRKYEPECFICESLENIVDFKDKRICQNALKNWRNRGCKKIFTPLFRE